MVYGIPTYIYQTKTSNSRDKYHAQHAYDKPDKQIRDLPNHPTHLRSPIGHGTFHKKMFFFIHIDIQPHGINGRYISPTFTIKHQLNLP